MSAEKTVERFESEAEFRSWLQANHAMSPGIWLTIAKKGATFTTPTYAEALDVALCFGWIDSQGRSLDDESYLQAFTPRKSRSPWSKRNVGKAERLIANGLMQPAGFAEIERAKSDGRWERAYEGSRTAQPPADFLAALERNPAAKEFYATLNSANRFAIYYRVQEAKRPETRARRIEKFIDMLAKGEKLH